MHSEDALRQSGTLVAETPMDMNQDEDENPRIVYADRFLRSRYICSSMMMVLPTQRSRLSISCVISRELASVYAALGSRLTKN